MKNTKDVFKLTNPQTSIWNMENFFEDTTINNICTSVVLYEELDIPKIKQALNNLVKNHDSFRIQIHMKDNIPYQSVAEFEPFDVEVVNAKNESEMKKYEKEMVDYKFNIIDSVLYRFKIVLFENKCGGIILNLSHMIADSWSLGLTVQEYLKEYHALKNNETLDEVSNSYIDYINAEQEYKQSEKFENDKKFWNDMFETIPELATIPTTKKIKNNISSKAKREIITVDADLVSKINNFCKEEKLSAFNFLMAIYSIYIGRVSNLDNFVIGTPILNRTNFKEKHTTGMFVNTVPVKIDIPENGTFTEFAHNLSTNMMSILKHQKYSYNTILEDLREKHNSLPNLYNIIISYQITKAFDSQYGNYKGHWAFNNYCGNDMNIHISDVNDTGTLEFSYDYLTDKYSLADIKNLHARIMSMVNQILESKDIQANEIEIVTEEEKNKILNDFNNTAVDYPKDKTIVDLFEEQVEKTPDNIAVVFGNQSLTYKELNEKANSLARYLIDNGTKPNDICAVILNRSIEMIIAILSVIKSGAAYIPVDPSYPKDRIEYIIKDSKIKKVLTNNLVIPTLPNLNFDIVNLDNDNLFKNSTKNPKINHSLEDLFYLIYTSGSTGTPKGVMLKKGSIANLTNYCNNYIDYLKKSKYRSIVSVTTVSFDIFIFETLISLQRGLKLVIASEDAQTDAALLNDIFKKEHIEIMQTTPSRMKLLLNNFEYIPLLKNLKYLTLAGEQLPITLVNVLKKISPNIVIYNGYGPSETTVFSSLTNITNHKEITIGKPLDNTKFYILDNTKNLCPIGIPGELYISGDGVGKGYINKAELTKNSFIKDKFNKNLIMYKSGDIGYYNDNGEVTCLGRSDSQVKIRGLRIELEEIEQLILKFATISGCCVIKKTINSREFLCAYYTTNDYIDESLLRKFLSEKLPQYMVPQYFIKLDKFPYTPNGKIDKKLLPMPNQNIKKHIEKPRNNTDKKLIKIIETILSTKNISISDNIMELGADSLTAINLSTKIYETFKTKILIKNILNHPKISDLSDYIVSLSVNENKQIRITKAKEKEYYPLSSAQKRIYYTSKMIGDKNLVYNITGGILIDTILKKSKVEKCLNKIIEKQSSFRTCFIPVENDIKQKILDNVTIQVPEFKNTSSETNSLVNAFAKPFDLNTAPLLRAEIHYIDDKQTLLLMDSHHIIMDGSSLHILIEEFCKLYNDNEIDDLKLEYKDFSIWENKYINSENIKDSENYWLKKFKNIEISSLNLPYDFNIPANDSYDGNTITNLIDEVSFEKYVNYARKLGISPYMFFISALFVLLYKYTGQNSITIGSPTTGRIDSKLSDIIGMFVNNIVVNGNIDSNKSFKDFVNVIKSQVFDDLNHQDYPYDLLVKKLGNANSLFDVMFTYQNTKKNELIINDKQAKILTSNSKISKFNLSVEINPSTHIINLEYNTNLFKKATICRLYKHYITLLNQIISTEDIIIKDIKILSQQDEDLIFNYFNNTTLDYPSKNNLVELFDDIATKYKNNIAIVQNDTKLTYKELDEKSNTIANALSEKGISKGDVIGVYLPRSPELIVSIWAILKIGAIYMPIYSEYPKDRISYMLKNSVSPLVLTNSTLVENLDFSGMKGIINSVDEIDGTSNLNSKIDISPEDIAYIIYTSGSTGRPKGVQIKHSNLINFVYAFKNYYNNEMNENDSLLASTNISFDVSIYELFLPILSGSKLVLYTEEIIQNIFTFCNSIIENKITTLYIPPNILNETYDILKDSNSIKIDKMLVGVEPIRKTTLNKYFNLNPNIKIVNGYGPTETTICCTALCYQKDESNDNIVSIGRPLFNDHVYILDNDKNIQPIGIAGELYVTGNGVGNGYLNNPTETNKNYQNNIFDNTSKKMYKTGDLAKWNLDGTIDFIGRNDSQVKLSGHRIELSEIDNVIMQYPSVNKAFSLIHTRGSTQYLVSYFVAENKIKIQDLITFLKSKLANYMVPSFIMQLDSFPLTPNGKIDKKNLPTSFIKKSKKYVAPKNDIEKQIVQIWQNLFLLDKISITDNFFDLGGDSLVAIKFQLEAMHIGLNIKYSDIFAHPTPRELAEQSLNQIAKTYNVYKDYNFSKIHKLLEINDVKNINGFKKFKLHKNKIGNILLIGATGFLGAHLLDNYLTTQNGIAYCLIRKKSLVEPEERLKKTLNFYFGNKYNDYFGKRIVVVDGDIAQPKLNLPSNLFDNINIVVHSAALVKHYGTYEQFNDVNITGTKNIINFCKKYNKKLYYISTLSVSGNMLSESNSTDPLLFTEKDFYIGQNLDNLYIYTKFEAERIIYNEIVNGNLSACVLRLGNITNRFSDGKFQINASENAFLNRLKSMVKLGVLQEKYLNQFMEFTPVDLCADAIFKIISSNPKFTTFHLYNNNFIQIKKLLEILDRLDFHISPVSDKEFADTVNKFLDDPELKSEISGIITDLNEDKLLNLIHYILPTSMFTQNYLRLLDFKWPKINNRYIKKYINYFINIKYL